MSEILENYIVKNPLDENEEFFLRKGYEICKKEYKEKIQKEISALKIKIDYPECILTNSRGDTFRFKNNSRNEGLIDFLSLHEEGLRSFL